MLSGTEELGVVSKYGVIYNRNIGIVEGWQSLDFALRLYVGLKRCVKRYLLILLVWFFAKLNTTLICFFVKNDCLLVWIFVILITNYAIIE